MHGCCLTCNEGPNTVHELRGCDQASAYREALELHPVRGRLLTLTSVCRTLNLSPVIAQDSTTIPISSGRAQSVDYPLCSQLQFVHEMAPGWIVLMQVVL